LALPLPIPTPATDGIGGGDHGPAPRVRRQRAGGGAGGGAAVAGAGDGAGAGGQRRPRGAILPHHAQAQPHRRDHPLAQRRRGAARLLPRPHLDGGAREVRRRLQALHQAGEHRHPDMRRRLLRPRLQRYVKLWLFVCLSGGWRSLLLVV